MTEISPVCLLAILTAGSEMMLVVATGPRQLWLVSSSTVSSADVRRIITFADRKRVAGSPLNYQGCLDLCYPLLERPHHPSSDRNTWDFHKCMNACLQRNLQMDVGMDEELAWEMVRVSFQTSRELQGVLVSLKENCSAEDYQRYAGLIAQAIDFVNDALRNTALAAHPEFAERIEVELVEFGQVR